MSSFLTFWVSSCFGPHPSLPRPNFIVLLSTLRKSATALQTRLNSVHFTPAGKLSVVSGKNNGRPEDFWAYSKTTFSLGTYVCKFSPPVFNKRVCTQKKVRLIGENLRDRERRKKPFLTRPDEREGVIHQT